MSEERFTFEYDDGQWGVPLFYDDGKKLCFDDVCILLNEQQSTISALKEENEQLKKEHKIAIDEMITDYKNLEKENRQMAEKLFILNEKYGL